MKNLLIYISPKNQFNDEHRLMIEVQIDNSLDYWEKKDIVLLTNFPYEYNGVKAIVGPDSLINNLYWKNPRGIVNSKINGIIYLLENKLIEETWFHDLDSFQIAPLDVELKKDIGLTCYGIYPPSKFIKLNGTYKHRINFGNVFFKKESLDIFKELLKKMDTEDLYEEDAMTLMFERLSDRLQIMDQSYNIGIRCTTSNIRISEKPIKVVHFPPHTHWLTKMRALLPPRLTKLLDARFNDNIPDSQ